MVRLQTNTIPYNSMCVSSTYFYCCTGMFRFVLIISENFFVIKPTRYTNFPNLLRHKNLHVSGSLSANHQEFIHCTLGTGICHIGLKTAFEQNQVLLESCLQTCTTYISVECTVNKLLMMGRGTARKNVEFHVGVNLKNW